MPPPPIDTDSVNEEHQQAIVNNGGANDDASPEAAMEDLALSPVMDEQNASASLIPLHSMTDSASGSRPLPSLHAPITFRDVPFIALYVVHILFMLLATNGIRSTTSSKASEEQKNLEGGSSSMEDPYADSTHSPKLNAESVGVSLRSLCVVNILFSVGWLLLFLFYSKLRFVQGSCSFSTVGLMILGAVLLIMGNGDALFLGVLVLATVLTDLVWMFKSKNGFDFVAVLFELVVQFLATHPSLGYVVCGTLIAYTIWASWVCTTVAFVGQGVSPWSFSMLYVYFHFYWTSNIFKNILTLVVSGTMMIWYYKDDSTDLSPQMKAENISDHDSPTDLEANGASSGNGSALSVLNATFDRKVVMYYVRCALSSSFGSICIGSLLCPLAHILWNILRWARRDESLLSKRFVSLRSERVEDFIRTYHKYSFVHIAGYGKPFYVAANDAWHLIETRGVEAIVDDDLTSRLLLLGANGWASIMSAMCVSALSDSGHGVFFALVSFTLCYTSLSIATQAIAAVIKTLFVCFAENPTRLSQLHPLIYHRFVRLAELQSFREHKAPHSTRPLS